MTSSITVRPAQAGDIPAMAQAHWRALAAWNDFYDAFYVEDVRNLISEMIAMGMNKPGTQYLVAEDSVGGVVGFVRWQTVPATGEPGPGTEPDEVVARRKALLTTKEHLKDLWEKFGERGDEMEKVHDGVVKGRQHLHIVHLMIDPSYQRRGIGGVLLSAVTAKAEAERLPAFITASREAHGLYLKHGFNDIGDGWPIDNAGWMERVVARERDLGMEVSEREQLLARVREMDPEMEWLMVKECRL